MTIRRMVQCVKRGQEAEGMARPPFANQLGQPIALGLHRLGDLILLFHSLTPLIVASVCWYCANRVEIAAASTALGAAFGSVAASRSCRALVASVRDLTASSIRLRLSPDKTRPSLARKEASAVRRSF